MSEILSKIQKRDKVFFSMSEKILSNIKENLDKAFQYLIKEDRPVEWVSIQLVDGTTNFVYIEGIFKPRLGDIITYADGSRSEITKDNINNAYKNFVRVMLSIDVLENGSPVEMYEKLKDYNQLNSLLSKDELIDLINETHCEDLSDLLHDDNILSRLTRPPQIAGFLTRDMTEEQVVQLSLYSLREPEKTSKH